MDDYPSRKTSDLRRGRLSIPNSDYFITLCTHQRVNGLTHLEVGNMIVESLRMLHQDKDIYLFCATIMPDHVHLLFRLLDRLTLGQTINKLKVKASAALKKSQLSWQQIFFDHRLRENEDKESFAFYMFMNPYTKDLLSLDESWTWWIQNQDHAFAFNAKMREGDLPQHAWLKKASNPLKSER